MYEVGVNEDEPDTVFVVELWESGAAQSFPRALRSSGIRCRSSAIAVRGVRPVRFEVVGSPLRDLARATRLPLRSLEGNRTPDLATVQRAVRSG
jgi:hypothetical protein